MLDVIQKLNSCKEDIVFVGGVAEMIQGKRDNTVDIDICVLNLNGLSEFGLIKKWTTQSVFSQSGQRAGFELDGFIIDIFIEKELPDYLVINQLKVVTLPYLIDLYPKIIEKLDPIKNYNSRLKMIKKLDNLIKN